jgi:DNA-binding XRE family transcriptional regulator
MARTSQHKRRREQNKRLQALRINEGLTRDDLARRTGVSRESIRLAELGFVPGPRIQFALADAFHLRPLDIWPLERQRVAAA